MHFTHREPHESGDDVHQHSPLHPPSHRSSQNWVPYLKVTALGIAGFISALMVWEGILQLAVESRRGASEHFALGKVENPGFMLHSKEGFSRTRLNSLGMRSPEPTPKQPGEYRILVLGDSFTRADEVADGLNFSDRLQSALNTDPPSAPSSVHVINAGKPSASPASYLYAAAFHNQTFLPDSTVIQLSESDFIQDMNNPASEFYTQSIEGDQAYRLVRNGNFGSVDPLAQAVMHYMPSLRSLMQMSVLRVGGRNLHTVVTATAPEEESLEPTNSLLDSQHEDAALVNWTVKQLNQKFPNLVLVFIPAMNYQDADTVSHDERNAALEKALVAAAAREGVPLLNMRSDFLTHYRAQGSHLKGFSNTLPGQGHLNRTGHELVAHRLIEFYHEFPSPLTDSTAPAVLNNAANFGLPHKETK